MQRMRHACLIIGLLIGTVLGSRSSEAQYSANYQTNTITISSNWVSSVGYVVGSNWVFDALQIISGGVLSNGTGYVGYEVAASNNSAVVSGSGSAWSNSINVYVGYSGSGNSVVVSNRGTVFSGSALFIGDTGTSTSNSVVVAGTGSVWNSSVSVFVGQIGSGNSLVISNGGTVVNGVGEIGNGSGSSNNSVLVTGSGSVWSNLTDVIVGDSGSGNSLVISSGGAVADPQGYLGYNAGGNNTVLVAGNGSVWNSTTELDVGYHGTGNSLVISNGGMVVSSSLYLGYMSTSSNNLVTLNGGNLTVTNALTNGVLDVRRGTLTLNSGTITADQFWATNGVSSVVIFNGGTLTVNNKLVTSNGAALWYGLGTNNNPMVTTSNLTLGGTLNITDAGGFTNGTYTLFRYGGTLTTNGTAGILTIDTKPNTNWIYTVDISSNGYVKLSAGPPVAGFSASTTNGAVPLAVTFTDTSSGGEITNRYWSFGDGNTTNFATATNPVHTYTTAGTNTVSLTVSGPGGTDTLNRSGYIVVTNALAPVITAGLTLTNALLQVGNVAVVAADDTNVFSIVATNLGPGTLSYQWSFGDGVTNAWSSSGTAEHAYTNCGPYTASVTISNGWAVTTTNFTVTVACELDIANLQPKLNFAKSNADSCTVKGRFELPSDYNFAGKLATLDIGGTNVSFTLDSKGKWHDSLSTFSKPTYKKKTGLWTFNAMLKNGSLQSSWAMYGMTNYTILRPGALVTNFPVIFLVDTEAFTGTTNLHYTAKQGKSGSAK
ncbi:MAG: PKD domain-containing protein [Verrucomicrobiia bacterium]